ncbi:3-keto-5-aminohexanoate cleavage protein [Nocardia jiangxiensis]|uniref:3-keto-5-aminohexanoate cleavage protein n=1 Tax=Nocardia jiangxiensis TaxID=282685 RepID=A0ABW6SE37_9NOCA|nr:3-keto-5-aminohexanoate cleavage protein [Nocardia jiangxiensis]
MAEKPLVIVAAVNGGAQQSRDGAIVPVTTEEIVEEAVRCEEAGATVLHFHGRNSEGRNTGDPAVYAEIIRQVRQKTKLLIQCTNGIGYRIDPTTGEHVFPPDAERLALLNLDPTPDYYGAMTVSIDFYDPDGGFPQEASFRNSGRFLSETIRTVYSRGSVIEFEIPHISSLHRLHRYLAAEGIDPASPYIALLMPIIPSFVPDHRTWLHLQDEAKRMFPNAIRNHVGSGSTAFEAVALALAVDFECVRVGFESSLNLADGSFARHNYQQVAQAVEIARIFGRRPATPDEAVKILQLDRGPQQLGAV